MIIKDIRTTRLSIPWTEMPKWGFAPVEKRSYLLADIETDEGIIGMGYLQPLMGGIEAIEACLHHQLKPLLLGQEDADRIPVEGDVYRHGHGRPHGYRHLCHIPRGYRPLGRPREEGRATFVQALGRERRSPADLRQRMLQGIGWRRNDRESPALC